MESRPQNPEFRINPENFHPCNIIESLTLTISHINVPRRQKIYLMSDLRPLMIFHLLTRNCNKKRL